MNQETLGKRYARAPFELSEEIVALYADATAYPEALMRDGIAPPMIAVRPLIEIMFDVIEDPEVGIDLVRLVHGEQEMIFHAPLRAGDRVVASGEITAFEQKESGETLLLTQRLERDGELVCEATSNLFVRAAGKPKHKRAASDGEEQARTPEEPYSEEETIARDQSLRYADASGDHNPLHKDPEFAKSAGLPDVILHGLCTMAIASRALITSACEGDATRLASYSVRFARPVFPGQTLTTRVWREASDSDEFRLETVNEDGERVLSRGHATARRG